MDDPDKLAGQILTVLGALWKKYDLLDDNFLPRRYKSESDNVPGIYHKSAKGFLWWLADGCPTDFKERSKLEPSQARLPHSGA